MTVTVAIAPGDRNLYDALVEAFGSDVGRELFAYGLAHAREALRDYRPADTHFPPAPEPKPKRLRVYTQAMASARLPVAHKVALPPVRVTEPVEKARFGPVCWCRSVLIDGKCQRGHEQRAVAS